MPADLSGHQLIAFESFAGPHTWRFWQGNEAMDVGVRPRFVTNSADAAITCAERVGGLTLVLSYQVATHVREGRLQVVMADFEPPPLPVHIVYASSRLLSIKVRALIEAVTSSRNWDFTNLSD